MAKMLFYLQFKGQLRRTRPELIASLERSVADSVHAAGGVMGSGRKILAASFDEKRIGFPLDLVVSLEKIHRALEEAGRELYGWALVLAGGDIGESLARELCRREGPLDGRGSTGIWCSPGIRKSLEFYAEFDDRGACDDESGLEDYRVLLEFRPFEADTDEAESSCRASPAPGAAPLVIRFGRGAPELLCFADAFTPRIRSFLAGVLPEETVKELDASHARLFRERLRREWPPNTREEAARFIRTLLRAYSRAAESSPDGVSAASGIIVPEDISTAPFASGIFLDAYSSLEVNSPEGTPQSPEDKEGGTKPLLAGMDGLPEKRPDVWDGLFSRIREGGGIGREDPEARETPGDTAGAGLIPNELWEIALNVFLLGRYFPPYLFPSLFEEEGLSRDLYFFSRKVFSALHPALLPDSRPEDPSFLREAERILGPRAERIREMVRGRILAWGLSGKIRPSFDFLAVLRELGEKIPGALALKSLKADVFNGTWKGIENAVQDGSFDSVVGSGNAPIFRSIYRGLKALVWDRREDIRRVFEEPIPRPREEDEDEAYSGSEAHVFANLAAFHIACRNTEAALEAARKALILNRALEGDEVPAYRFFSLANVLRQRIDDAVEYISYALDKEGRFEQNEEMILSSYYASSINMLYGNLSKAERLALAAEETASELGQPEWGKKARFTRGRLCFEAGRYREALAFFESLAGERGAESDAGASSPEMAETAAAWIFRTRNFLDGFVAPGAPLSLSCLDAKLFEIEAACFASDYERTIALADEFFSLREDGIHDGFIFTERPDWRSGFSQCEFMFQREKLFGERLAWIYRAMAQCALRPSGETKLEILGRMQRFMREELPPDTDPHDTFYFYAWYCMLRDTKAAPVDMNTIVSMAFRRLQRRAARIEDGATRQAFLNLPPWNHTLYLAAREYKLI